MTVPLTQQISALDLAIRILSGSAPKPSKKEATFIVERLKAADNSLYYLQRNEAAIKAAVARKAERQGRAA